MTQDGRASAALARELELRDATAADLPAIFAIYDQEVLHGTTTFDVAPLAPEERLDWFHTHSGPRRPVIVATRRGELLGWGCLSSWSERCAYARAAEDSVYVAKEARGLGVGKAILLELIRRARAAGLGVLLARVVEGNPASLALHETLGFVSVGVMHRVGEKLGRILDVHLLELPLDTPPAHRRR